MDYSFADYLRVDCDSAVRHEFVDGVILAVAGGTPEHAALAAAVIMSLASQLEGRPCRVFSEALRVRAPATKFAGYADVTVVCSKLELDPDDRHTVLNPSVLVEVLSPSTALYDRTQKLRHYQSIPSVHHIVFIPHDAKAIEVVTREADGWRVETAGPGERAALTHIACELDVDAVFRDPLAGA